MRDVLRYLCHLCRHFGCGVARFADDGFWEIYCPVCEAAPRNPDACPNCAGSMQHHSDPGCKFRATRVTIDNPHFKGRT